MGKGGAAVMTASSTSGGRVDGNGSPVLALSRVAISLFTADRLMARLWCEPVTAGFWSPPVISPLS
ncbi:hypothetical protein D3C72_2261410 [compost metagenome]